MELQFPILSLIFTFILSIFILAKHFKRSNSKPNNSIPKLPPGPWTLPLIGNMHQLIGNSLVHHTLKDLAKKYGPLMHLRLGEVSTIVVSSPEIAKEVLKTHDLIFSQRPYLLGVKILSYDSTNIAFAPYGGYWRQLRKICVLELLSAKRVQTFRPIREHEVSNLIESISLIARSVPVNLSKKIFELTYGITARAAFGKKTEHQEVFIVNIEEAVRLLGGFSIADMYPSVKILANFSGMRTRLEEVHRKIDEILENILSEHKERDETRKIDEREVEEDLVDVLLKFQRQADLEFPFNDDNLKAVILDIFSAGSETSSTTVEWAMSEMLKNPKVMQKAQAEVREVFKRTRDINETQLHELKYLKSIIKETLRLHPSAPLLVPRESSEQCQINGYDIPAKTRVIINAWAMARDPKNWTEPEKFRPERFLDSPIDFKGTDFELIPFGAGRRICPGILFALPNIELPLAQLLYHFDWKLPNGVKEEELDMTEAFGLTVRRKNDLYLIPIPYNSMVQQ